MQASNPRQPAQPLSAHHRGRDAGEERVAARRQHRAGALRDASAATPAAQPQPPRAWVAVIRYRYSGEPMSAEDRFVNPLGFQVLRYRRDAEALPPPSRRRRPPPTVPAATVPTGTPAQRAIRRRRPDQPRRRNARAAGRRRRGGRACPRSEL